jgi:hypothetical protein
MDLPARQLLLCLFAAHVLADFLLQTAEDVATKRRWQVLLNHVLVVTAISYCFAGYWTSWRLVLAVGGSHAVIDALKARVRSTPWTFLLDQTAHLAALVLIARWLGSAGPTPYWLEQGGAVIAPALVVFSGAIVSIYAGGYLIGLALRPFLAELDNVDRGGGLSRGFSTGGMVIGRLERALIFMFVLVGQPAGVGFLIAAKSVFRFGELKEHANRMEAEYIIIGTLMSFGYGLLAAYATSAAMNLAWV